MFEAWGHVVFRRRRLILVIAALGVIFAAVWGTGVFGALQSAGGFNDPGSQSQQATDLATRAFGRDASDVVVLYRSESLTVHDAAYLRLAGDVARQNLDDHGSCQCRRGDCRRSWVRRGAGRDHRFRPVRQHERP